jgi:epoxyqueuosine reductase
MSQLSADLKSEAQRLGFDLVGIAPAVNPVGFSALQEWLDHGFAGEMQYMERRRDAYAHPEGVLPGVRSVVMLGLNYRTEEPVDPAPAEGRVSRYAWGTTDYHTVLRQRLKQLSQFLKQRAPGSRSRGIVDTAPLLERDFARLAGLGWFGKNTLLINKRRGSWMFLSGLLTDLELEYDSPHDTSHCGSCTRCLDACPTDAFEAPYVLDARKCISYLTIELRGPIPKPLRAGMEDWLFGCDVCQDVCPWNRKAPTTNDPIFQPQPGLRPADAARWLQLSAEDFEREFADTPLSRPGRAGLLRNAAIVLGNSGDSAAIPVLLAALQDVEPLIRGAAVWALQQLGGDEVSQALKELAERETDPIVLDEFDPPVRMRLHHGDTENTEF